MKIEITDQFKVVTPEDGMYLYDNDSPTLIAYMPLSSNPEEYWTEITQEEGDRILEEKSNLPENL